MNFVALCLGLLRRRRVAALLSLLAIATGTALVTGIVLLREGSREAFSQKDTGYEVIVGAKGAPLQLVLNTMYHVGTPVGNIPLEVYETLERDRRVGMMLPMVFGDNVHGYKVVGTTDRLFTTFMYRKEQRVAVAAGRPFRSDYEAVLGSEAAATTGLAPGSTVVMTHGMHEGGHVHDFERLTITGVLAPTGTAIDRGVFTTMRTVWDAHYRDYRLQQEAADALLAEAAGEEPEHEGHNHEGHDHEGHDHEGHEHRHTTGEEPERDTLIPPEFTTITAIAVTLKSPVFFDSFVRSVNERTAAQAVLPVREIAGLFAVIGNLQGLLLAIAYIVVLLGGVSMFIAMYTSLHERRREIAVLRALGAHRRTVLALVLTEAVVVGLAGALTGLLGAHLLLWAFQPYIASQTGVALAVTGVYAVEAAILGGVLLLSLFVALIPAVAAYRVDVSDQLVSTG